MYQNWKKLKAKRVNIIHEKFLPAAIVFILIGADLSAADAGKTQADLKAKH